MAVKKTTTAAKAKNLTAARKKAMAEKVINNSPLGASSLTLKIDAVKNLELQREASYARAKKLESDLDTQCNQISNVVLDTAKYKQCDKVVVVMRGVETTVAIDRIFAPSISRYDLKHPTSTLLKLLQCKYRGYVLNKNGVPQRTEHEFRESEILRRA